MIFRLDKQDFYPRGRGSVFEARENPRASSFLLMLVEEKSRKIPFLS